MTIVSSETQSAGHARMVVDARESGARHGAAHKMPGGRSRDLPTMTRISASACGQRGGQNGGHVTPCPTPRPVLRGGDTHAGAAVERGGTKLNDFHLKMAKPCPDFEHDCLMLSHMARQRGG